MNQYEQEFVKLFNEKIQEIENLLKEKNLNDLIKSFNEFANTNDMIDYIIHKNNKATWDWLNTTNTQEEIQEGTAVESFDKSKPYFLIEYSAYFRSLNEVELIDHIQSVLEESKEYIKTNF
jgi:uncharacterized membrane protein YheB (UPF0754 family)